MGGGNYFTDPLSHSRVSDSLVIGPLGKVEVDSKYFSANNAESKTSLSLPGAKKNEEKSAIPTGKANSEYSAALLIQSVFRGHLVRREEPLNCMRIIDGVRKDLNLLKAECCWDEELKLNEFSSQHQKSKLTESLMALLLRLDVAQSSIDVVRFARKEVAKSLNSILDSIESIPIRSTAPVTSVSTPGNHLDVSAKSSGNSKVVGGSVKLEDFKLIEETKTVASESESLMHQLSEAVPQPSESSEEFVEPGDVSSSNSEDLKNNEIKTEDFRQSFETISASDSVRVEEVTAPGAASGAPLSFVPGAAPGAASGVDTSAAPGAAPGVDLGAAPGVAPGAGASVKAKDVLDTRGEMESLKNQITYLEALTHRLVEENRSL